MPLLRNWPHLLTLKVPEALTLQRFAQLHSRHLPLAGSLVKAARQQLVHRLDSYMSRANEPVFRRVLVVLDTQACFCAVPTGTAVRLHICINDNNGRLVAACQASPGIHEAGHPAALHCLFHPSKDTFYTSTWATGPVSSPGC